MTAEESAEVDRGGKLRREALIVVELGLGERAGVAERRAVLGGAQTLVVVVEGISKVGRVEVVEGDVGPRFELSRERVTVARERDCRKGLGSVLQLP